MYDYEDETGFYGDEEDELPFQSLHLSSGGNPRHAQVALVHRQCSIRLGNIRVSVVAGNIWEQKVDVVVNSVSTDLNLSRGRSSKALLDAAGRSIQQKCNQNYPNGINYGEFAVTGPGKLKCVKIYHTALVKYSGPEDIQALGEMVYECMRQANGFKKRSIAFPALGTGWLGYSSEDVAEVMFDCVDEFAQETNSTLQDVLFVIYSQDTSTLRSFRAEAQQYSSMGGIRISRQMNDSYCCTFGSLSVEVLVGQVTEVQTLMKTVTDCLLMANKYPIASIVFPTLGTGSLNFPPDTALKTFVRCLAEFDNDYPKTKLKNIIIVIYEGANDYERIANCLRGELGKPLPVIKGKQLSSQSVSPRTCCSGHSEQVGITVAVDNLASQHVDVIVNSTSQNLNLRSSSGLSAALLQKAGQRLQDELDQNYPNGIKPREIAKSNGHRLNCREVYHCTLVSWYAKNSKMHTPEEVVEETVLDMLLEANQSRYSTISFPALGTGYQKFPPDVTASHMIKAIQSFTAKVKRPSIKEIRIVLYNGGQALQHIETAFQKEINTLSVSPSQQTITRGIAPKRGTMDFCKWMYLLNGRPPSYWTHFTAAKNLKEWNVQLPGVPCHLENVDSVTKNAISSAFLQTFGYATLNKPQIIRICRIENTTLYLKYFEESQRLFRKAFAEGGIKQLTQLPKCSGPVIATDQLNQAMKQHLYEEINEFYFFHGTKSEVVDVIIGQGLDSRLANPGRLGNGVYGAERASKSHTYATHNQRGEFFMFILRMCLGDAFITGRENKHYTRGPCRKCSSPKCSQHAETFDSVVADGGVFSDREFVVYDRAQCYPEYLIVYTT